MVYHDLPLGWLAPCKPASMQITLRINTSESGWAAELQYIEDNYVLPGRAAPDHHLGAIYTIPAGNRLYKCKTQHAAAPQQAIPPRCGPAARPRVHGCAALRGAVRDELRTSSRRDAYGGGGQSAHQNIREK